MAFDEPAMAEDDAGPWQVVWRGVAETEASIIAGSLEADGIPAQVEGARREHGLLAGSFDHGVYAVYVPGTLARHARRLLRESGEGVNVIAEPVEEETTPADTVRFVLAGVLVLVIIALVVYFAS
jgi:hypothetical protein